MVVNTFAPSTRVAGAGGFLKIETSLVYTESKYHEKSSKWRVLRKTPNMSVSGFHSHSLAYIAHTLCTYTHTITHTSGMCAKMGHSISECPQSMKSIRPKATPGLSPTTITSLPPTVVLTILLPPRDCWNLYPALIVQKTSQIHL